MNNNEKIKEIFVDKELKEIAITHRDGKVIAVIQNDCNAEIIQSDDILVRFNYGEQYKYKEVDGKVYIPTELE